MNANEPRQPEPQPSGGSPRAMRTAWGVVCGLLVASVGGFYWALQSPALRDTCNAPSPVVSEHHASMGRVMLVAMVAGLAAAMTLFVGQWRLGHPIRAVVLGGVIGLVAVAAWVALGLAAGFSPYCG